MNNCSNEIGQLWKLEPDGNGNYRLKNKFRGDGECLEGNQINGTAKAGSAFMDKCQNVTGQFWKIEKVQSGDER
ncbi:MAG: RICIN domain-containing protein [Saprospiraceae bacterium]|nr:RICIN domain-containing protein [Saprospiraceae bacterium]